jgi:hypothetical protein
METVLDMIRRICDAVLSNPLRSLGIGGFLLAAVVRSCLGDRPVSHSYKEDPPKQMPGESIVKVGIDKEVLENILKTFYSECRANTDSTRYCGKILPAQEGMRDSSSDISLSTSQGKEQFDKDSLLAMYRSDIILQANPNKWEYLKVKNFLPEIDGFVARYAPRLAEIKQAYGDQGGPNIQWALNVIPEYQENVRPGLDAKIRRMQ